MPPWYTASEARLRHRCILLESHRLVERYITRTTVILVEAPTTTEEMTNTQNPNLIPLGLRSRILRASPIHHVERVSSRNQSSRDHTLCPPGYVQRRRRPAGHTDTTKNRDSPEPNRTRDRMRPLQRTRRARRTRLGQRERARKVAAIDRQRADGLHRPAFGSETNRISLSDGLDTTTGVLGVATTQHSNDHLRARLDAYREMLQSLEEKHDQELEAHLEHEQAVRAALEERHCEELQAHINEQRLERVLIEARHQHELRQASLVREASVTIHAASATRSTDLGSFEEELVETIHPANRPSGPFRSQPFATSFAIDCSLAGIASGRRASFRIGTSNGASGHWPSSQVFYYG